MVENDPPNDERKKATIANWVQGFSRILLNRRTLIIAFQVLYWIVKIARLLSRLMGGS